MEPLIVACVLIAVLCVGVQAAIVTYDWRDRRAVYARIRAIRIEAPPLTVADLEAVDFDAPQPLAQVSHDHVWPEKAEKEDATSRTFYCQIPRCPRIHTQMKG